jgi:hypothetical protein
MDDDFERRRGTPVEPWIRNEAKPVSMRDPSDPPLQYRVYWNGGNGGPVDYTTPIATTAAPMCVVGPLNAPGSYLFGVRTHDPIADLEEANTDVVAHVRLNAAGADRTGVPESPRFVALSAMSEGRCRVEWVYISPEGARPPTSFRVVLGTGSGGGAEVAAVPYSNNRFIYSTVVPGPLSRGSYWVEVNAIGALGEGPPSDRVSAVIGLATEPFSMEPVTVRVT